jgi:NADH:ubiquinone oxidoreductase subunit C
MDTQNALQVAESILQSIASQFARPATDRLDATIAAAQLPATVQALQRARFGYLSAVTGLDHPASAAKAGDAPPPAGRVEVLYHFCEGAAVVTLRVIVPYDAARVPSICHLIPSATLYERELGEMFGVTVEGTPVADHLLLPDAWPEGVYPLRKSFAGKVAGAGS